MPQLREHNRNTRAANADLLGDEATLKKPEAPSTPKAKPDAKAQPDRAAQAPPTEGKPGKDINQAGFLKDDAQGRP